MSVALHVLNTYYSFPMDGNLKIIFWNVRGLNCRAKHTVVRSVTSSILSCIVCLQEIKSALLSSAIVFEILNNQFEDFYFLPNGTRGGILLAWDSTTLTVDNVVLNDNFLTGLLHTKVGQPWWIMMVYIKQECLPACFSC